MPRKRSAALAGVLAVALLMGAIAFLLVAQPFSGSGRDPAGQGAAGNQVPGDGQSKVPMDGSAPAPSNGGATVPGDGQASPTSDRPTDGVELRVPVGLLGAYQADAQALLEELSIPFKVDDRELRPGQKAGTVVEVQPPENSPVTAGKDVVILTIGRGPTAPDDSAVVMPDFLVVQLIRAHFLSVDPEPPPRKCALDIAVVGRYGNTENKPPQDMTVTGFVWNDITARQPVTFSPGTFYNPAATLYRAELPDDWARSRSNTAVFYEIEAKLGEMVLLVQTTPPNQRANCQ
jgi:hypothetical protein